MGPGLATQHQLSDERLSRRNCVTATPELRWLQSGLVLLLGACGGGQPGDEAAPGIDEAWEIAAATIIVDTHIDVPYRLQEEYEDVTAATEKGHFDYPRAVRGGLNAPFMSIYVPPHLEALGGARQLADELIDLVEDIARRAPEKFAIAYSTGDVRRHFREGKISLPMGMENGSPIEGSLDTLRHFYDRGIRYITLAHSRSNHIADSSYDLSRRWQGLSPFGATVVEEMNRLGIMVDVSHLSDAAAQQAIELSAVPVIASHSSARSFTKGFERNMSDELIVRLAARGGVIQLNYGSVFLTAKAQVWYRLYKSAQRDYLQSTGFEEHAKEVSEWGKAYREQNPIPTADLKDVLDHIDHVVALVGVEHVGIGSDYDGVSSVPVGLEDVSTYPNLVGGLLARGYSRQDIEKIMGGNLLRVWSEVEQYAATHRRSGERTEQPTSP